MADDPFQLYPTIAQIAATFAGFGSLATGIGQRRGSDDARIDAYRVGFMLFASLSDTMLGLLPATLAGLSFGMRWALGAPAWAAVIALIIYVPISASRVGRMMDVAGFSIASGIGNTICALTALAAFAMCAAGMPAGRLADFYLLGLMGLLGSSVIMFSRVIVSMLRPHKGG